MATAAANLAPDHARAGGNCSALLTPGAVTPANVEAVIGTKIIKNGQMCVSVDHTLVQRGTTTSPDFKGLTGCLRATCCSALSQT